MDVADLDWVIIIPCYGEDTVAISLVRVSKLPLAEIHLTLISSGFSSSKDSALAGHYRPLSWLLKPSPRAKIALLSREYVTFSVSPADPSASSSPVRL